MEEKLICCKTLQFSCLADSLQENTLNLQTMTLYFLGKIHNKSQCIFHQLNTTNVKLQQ